ncbi:hypothetical protein [Streptomyces scabiei]|uniref:MmyB family transcriptional regulator n=1 Tax=Streptomyces scabiei TaxID=1930 RepID=UPI002D21E182|nr:hypothetical protein [Streptomyces scabiei]
MSGAGERLERSPLLTRAGRSHRSLAFVIGRRTDILGWNQLAAALWTDFGRYPEQECVFVRLLFTEPWMRELYADWEEVTRPAIAQLDQSATTPVSLHAVTQAWNVLPGLGVAVKLATLPSSLKPKKLTPSDGDGRGPAEGVTPSRTWWPTWGIAPSWSDNETFRQSVNRIERSWPPVPWAMPVPAWMTPRERSSRWSSSDRLRESAAGRRSTSGRSVR